MPTRIQKWGNSLGLRLPKEIAARFKLEAGSEVRIVPESKKITLKPVKSKRRESTLGELVREITEDNRYAEIGWGKSRGREAW